MGFSGLKQTYTTILSVLQNDATLCAGLGVCKGSVFQLMHTQVQPAAHNSNAENQVDVHHNLHRQANTSCIMNAQA